MRKKIRGYLYGAIRPAWLAAALDTLAEGVLNLGYVSQCIRKRKTVEALPSVSQARQLLEKTFPPPQKERPIQSAKRDPAITVSVIVPVYNVEAYVCQCLTSLQKQITEYPFEVIAIDDGATDQSGKLADS